MTEASGWCVAYRKAISSWRSWQKGKFKLQYIKTGGDSHFCLHGDHLIYKAGYSIQCSNLSTGALLWRADISADPELRHMQVDRVSGRVLCVSKTSNVTVYDNNGLPFHHMHPEGKIVQSELHNNQLFLLLKSNKQYRLDVLNVEQRTLQRSIPASRHSRFCLGSGMLILGETSALRTFSLPHLQPSLSVPTEPVHAHKAMATNGRFIFRVLKLAADSYEIQVIDVAKKALAWRLSAASPIRALLVDALRLVVAFQDNVRIWELATHELLMHLSKDIMQENVDAQLASLKLVEVKVPWTSVFCVPCVAFQPSRLLVKFPTEQHIVMLHFNFAADGGKMPPLRLSGLMPLEDEPECTSEATAVTMYGDRLGQAGPMAVSESALNLDEFA